MVYPMNITDIIKYIESTQRMRKEARRFVHKSRIRGRKKQGNKCGQGKDMNVTVQCTINKFAVSNTFDYNSWGLQVEHAINAVKIKKYKDVNGLLYYFVLMYVGNFFKWTQQ